MGKDFENPFGLTTQNQNDVFFIGLAVFQESRWSINAYYCPKQFLLEKH
jgi:hypothetical protein